jgi:hypothetical protein
LGGIKTPPAGRIGAGGGGAGARRPRSLLLTGHARTRALAALRAARAGARAAACRPASAQRLVLLALLGIEFGAAAGAQQVPARAGREAVQAARAALTLPENQRIWYSLLEAQSISLDTVTDYSDFHNLMGFTSKKMPNNIFFSNWLNNFLRISILLFPKILIYVLNDPKQFFFLFLHASTVCAPRKSYQLYRRGHNLILHTSFVHNFSVSKFFSQYRKIMSSFDTHIQILRRKSL